MKEKRLTHPASHCFFQVIVFFNWGVSFHLDVPVHPKYSKIIQSGLDFCGSGLEPSLCSSKGRMRVKL